MFKAHSSKIFCLVTFILLSPSVLAVDRPRVIVSTDIGGTDPDDYQSMVHLLVYADELSLEGLISSPFGHGRKQHILEVIDCYEKDFEILRTHSNHYPTPDLLRAISKQGETETAPYAGFRESTEGSQWIVECAKRDDPRPLYVLVWGGIEDLAQALHDAPEILPKLRVYFIGGPNKKWSSDAFQYIVDNHSDLWIIESNSTYRGWFNGGDQTGQWGNSTFALQNIAGHGALGELFMSKLDLIKMGDTPSVCWVLSNAKVDPTQPNWGGQYVRAWKRAHKRFDDLANTQNQIETFGIAEFAIPIPTDHTHHLRAQLLVENQTLAGHLHGDGTIRFRFCPKAEGTYALKISSTDKLLDGRLGSLIAINPDPMSAQHADSQLANWWTDDPSTIAAEGEHLGARSISRHRVDFLRDFASRLDRCTKTNLAK